MKKKIRKIKESISYNFDVDMNFVIIHIFYC